MIPLLVLAPAVIALVMLRSKPASHVLLYVYLPCLLLIPLYLMLPAGGLAIDASALVVTMLAAVGLWKQRRVLRLTVLDICVLLNVFSVFYADAHLHPLTIAGYTAVQILFASAFPYLVGRTLIEQTGSREKFARMFVLLLLFITIVSVWEYRMIANPFQEGVEALTHASSGWTRQMRWGFGRIAGPYGHAITAGMVFSIGLMFQLWLFTIRKITAPRDRRPLYLGFALLVGLFMTQSRGPWIGCAFGLVVACIGLFKNRKAAALVALTVLGVCLGVTSVVLDQYTGAAAAGSHDVNQQDAVYRRKLWDTYLPVVDQGGLWGWGTPKANGHGMYSYGNGNNKQASIDNDYLLVAVGQGYFGITLFVLTLGLCVSRLVKLCTQMRKREDIVFVFCMLGIVVGTAFSLSTVFLGQPMGQLLYLLFGWSQSIGLGVKPDVSTALPQAKAQPYVYERVYV